MTGLSTPATTGPARDVERAVLWLLRSGIQAPSGGCHAWFDEDLGYQLLYPEVTGYHVTFCEWSYAQTGDALAAAAAGRAVRWLLGLVDPDGGFRCLVPPASVGAPAGPADDASFVRKARRRYTFDAGIVLQGLVTHALRTDSTTVREAASALGLWLVRGQDTLGTFVPFVGEQSWHDVPADWSTRPGPHQAKIAIGLLALSEVEHDRTLADAAVRAARAALAAQQADGRFVTNQRTGGTNVHPHCYAAEACWAVGTATGDRRLLLAAEKATRFLLDHSAAGSVLGTFRPSDQGPATSQAVRVDGLAQTLRLAVLTGVASDPERDAIARGLLGFQATSTDPRVDGAFRFGFSASGELLPHANVWVTAFAAQALWLHRQGGTLDWRLLV